MLPRRRLSRRRGGPVLAAVAVAAGLALWPATAPADWSGDAKPDVLAVDPGGALLLHRGDGAGGLLTATPERDGTGWGSFTALLWPGDFSGDGKPDLLARQPNGVFLLYSGNGTGGFVTSTPAQVGTGWDQFTALLTPGDFSGDGRPDVLARRGDGLLFLYRGNGAGGWATAAPQEIGSGWQPFTALAAGDFSGDDKPDVLARKSDGVLVMYRGNGGGGWATGKPEQIGTSWQNFTAILCGDFSGDDKPDVLARNSDGVLMLYRGDGAGGFAAGKAQPISSGWGSLSHLTLVTGPAPWATPPSTPPPPPAPTPPPTAPVPDGNVTIPAGIGCTPPGGRLRVSMKVRRRKGRPAPRVLRVVFFIPGGPRKTDKRAPFAARLLIKRPAGSRGRVHARISYRRKGSRKIRHKTVSRRFVVCG